MKPTREDTVKWTVAATVLIAVAAVVHSLAAVANAENLASVEPRHPDSVRFIVVSDLEWMAVENAEAYAITSQGEVKLIGRTDEDGIVLVPKSILTPEKTRVLVFCREWFFCAAEMITDTSLQKHRESLIALSHFTVM